MKYTKKIKQNKMPVNDLFRSARSDYFTTKKMDIFKVHKVF
jgi:hypothetical protein